jgi:hypothetical protein
MNASRQAPHPFKTFEVDIDPEIVATIDCDGQAARVPWYDAPKRLAMIVHPLDHRLRMRIDYNQQVVLDTDCLICSTAQVKLRYDKFSGKVFDVLVNLLPPTSSILSPPRPPRMTNALEVIDMTLLCQQNIKTNKHRWNCGADNVLMRVLRSCAGSIDGALGELFNEKR